MGAGNQPKRTPSSQDPPPRSPIDTSFIFPSRPELELEAVAWFSRPAQARAGQPAPGMTFLCARQHLRVRSHCQVQVRVSA